MQDEYEKALKDVCDLIHRQVLIFMSEQYAVGQPMSSFSERYALNVILLGIDNLKTERTLHRETQQ